MRTSYKHRELYSGLCGDLNGKEIQRREDYTHVCIHVSDSLSCIAEINTVYSCKLTQNSYKATPILQ